MQPHFAQRFHRDRDDALFALPDVQQRFQRGLAKAIVICQPLRAENPQAAGAVFEHDGLGRLLGKQVTLVVPVRHHAMRQVVHALKITPLNHHDFA